MSSNSTPNEEQKARDAILKAQKQLMTAITQFAYHTNDAILLIPRKDDDEAPLGITFSYVTRSQTQLELLFTRELVHRIEQTVIEWTDWTQEQLEINHDTKF